MPLPSFPDWLASRSQEPAQADRLATLVASAGAAGVSRDRLRRLLALSPETLADLLKSLVVTGQVEMLKVNGELRYRARG
jgi:predicted transcriptional regulator